MKTKFLFCVLMVCPTLFVTGQTKPSSPPAINQVIYPAALKGPETDDYFGTRVDDPYRWMENDTSALLKDWITAENNLTSDYLAKIPFREKIRKRATELINYPRYSSPVRAGEYFFFSKNDGLQNQAVIYFQKGLYAEPEVFIDPNLLSTDGTIAVSLLDFSKDNKYVAYSMNRSGSDWQSIQVMEVATKKKLPDELNWIKLGTVAWKNDGFYYPHYDKPDSATQFSKKNEFQKVYYHKLGDAQENDQLIFEEKDSPQHYYATEITEDARFLIVSSRQGSSGNEIYYMDFNSGEQQLKPLFKGFKNNYFLISSIGDSLLFRTNENAPNQSVILVNPKSETPGNSRVLIKERPFLLQNASTGGGKLFLTYLKDVTSKVYQYSLQGRMEREIQLPALGTTGGIGGNADDKFMFYSFTSFTYPPVIFKFTIGSGSSDIWHQTKISFNPEDYETKQVFYFSKDGTRIPMFIVGKKGLLLNGKHPTILYGYGGFNVSVTPSFSASRMLLLENGGVFALANIRGGGEYGEKWHEGGKLVNKQNVFDDFISAAEYLIKQKYTSKDRLAIQGGSNGGLLVGACMTQRPDLFKVCLPSVGVMDMLRYQRYTVGWAWVSEYGSSDSAAYFPVLHKYSPLHNLKETSYPATLVTTADHDDRVVPAHSFKFAAALQEKQKGPNPILIRVDVKAGHGKGKPTSKIVDEITDVYSFLFYNMGVVPKYQ